jgi:hypothetical protein
MLYPKRIARSAQLESTPFRLLFKAELKGFNVGQVCWKWLCQRSANQDLHFSK